MRKPVLLAVIAAILAIPGSGCTPAPEIREVPVRLPLPPRPQLPRIAPQELECLSPDVYQRLEERQRKRRQYCETLEEIIKSTHVD